MATISEALAIALRHHQAGRLELAEQVYRRILAVESSCAAAWHGLGVVGHQTRRPAVALESLGRVVELRPGDPTGHFDLGSAFLDQGSNPEAITCFQRALQLKPDYVEAYNNLGLCYQAQDRHAEAIACYQQALNQKPEYWEAYLNLGTSCRAQGQLAEAIEAYGQAVRLNPENAEARYNLGLAFNADSRRGEAYDCFRQAVALNPDFAQAHNSLGNALRDRGDFSGALICFRRAVALQPELVTARSNLGTLLKETGALAESVRCFRELLAFNPACAWAHSNLLYTLIYCPEWDAPSLLREHQQWAMRHAAPFARHVVPHVNPRLPERQLRIGYLSPDFRAHPIGQLLLPVLESHDHDRFEIVRYSDVRCPDIFTDRCREPTDIWRDVASASDAQLAATIHRDQIDILLDLTMHMAHNRLLAFARKPAPIQVSWLAYPGTTGLSTMDYRLTDPYLDPPGANDYDYTEQTVRLPDSFWCYAPLGDEPPVSALPALAQGFVTFGCMNNFCKVHDAVLQLWARVLNAVPHSRMVLLAPEGDPRRRVLDLLIAAGIAPDRVEFVGLLRHQHYLEVYNWIDIALDTFPYNGHTTTLDGFYMGVPLVTLVGQTVVGRAGLSQLTNLGLPELIAHTPEDYVRIAVSLAGDIPRLAELRATLRERMQRSPLMDAPRFARGIEAAYRQMWRQWCSRGD